MPREAWDHAVRRGGAPGGGSKTVNTTMSTSYLKLAIALPLMCATAIAAAPPRPVYPQPDATDVPREFKLTWRAAVPLTHAKVIHLASGRVVDERKSAANPELSVGRDRVLQACDWYEVRLVNQTKDHETTTFKFKTRGCPPPIIIVPPEIVVPPGPIEPPGIVVPPFPIEPPVIVVPPFPIEPPVIVVPPFPIEPPEIEFPPVIPDPPVTTAPPVITEPPVITKPPVTIDDPDEIPGGGTEPQAPDVTPALTLGVADDGSCTLSITTSMRWSGTLESSADLLSWTSVQEIPAFDGVMLIRRTLPGSHGFFRLKRQ